jgi:hypothetical protein
MKMSDTKLVQEINAALREEFTKEDWGMTATVHNIPSDRLQEEIANAKRFNSKTVTVKIPSLCEFSMSLAHAEAVLRSIR